MNEMPEPLEYGTFVAPPFYGTGEMLTWQTNVLLESINTKRLYTDFWQYAKGSKNGTRNFEEDESEAMQNTLEIEILTDNLVNARGYYSFFPVITDGEQVILLDTNNCVTEIASFEFPKIWQNNKRSFADFFRPEMDILSVFAVTIGAELGNSCRKYDQKNDVKGFYLNGLGRYINDIVAEKCLNEIRRSLFIDRNQGLGYHFGKRGMPGLPEQEKLLTLLCAEDRLDIKLSNDFHLFPEHSSLGIFIHHPDIKNLK